MPDREKVIRHIVAEISIARTCKKDFASVDIDMLFDALVLLKEQETANLYKCPNCGTWVSAENVVRCKDCKHGKAIDDYILCRNKNDCYSRDPDWFCADGEGGKKMPDREKVISLLAEISDYFKECRANTSFASKAENHFWELQNAAQEAISMLKEQKEVEPRKSN